MLFVLNAKQDLKKIQMSSWFVYSIKWRKIFEKLPYIIICLVRCVEDMVTDICHWLCPLHRTVAGFENLKIFWNWHLKSLARLNFPIVQYQCNWLLRADLVVGEKLKGMIEFIKRNNFMQWKFLIVKWIGSSL